MPKIEFFRAVENICHQVLREGVIVVEAVNVSPDMRRHEEIAILELEAVRLKIAVIVAHHHPDIGIFYRFHF